MSSTTRMVRTIFIIKGCEIGVSPGMRSDLMASVVDIFHVFDVYRFVDAIPCKCGEHWLVNFKVKDGIHLSPSAQGYHLASIGRQKEEKKLTEEECAFGAGVCQDIADVFSSG